MACTRQHLTPFPGHFRVNIPRTALSNFRLRARVACGRLCRGLIPLSLRQRACPGNVFSKLSRGSELAPVGARV